MSCVACGNDIGGCERCRGGPGEQGFSADEKELLALRDENRHLRGLISAVERSGRGGVGCPWCAAPKGQHAERCPAFSGDGVMRRSS